MRGEVVDWNIHTFTRAEVSEMLHQKLRLQGIRMVEVDLRPFFEGSVGQVPVVGVVVDDGYGKGMEAP